MNSLWADESLQAVSSTQTRRKDGCEYNQVLPEIFLEMGPEKWVSSWRQIKGPRAVGWSISEGMVTATFLTALPTTLHKPFHHRPLTYTCCPHWPAPLTPVRTSCFMSPAVHLPPPSITCKHCFVGEFWLWCLIGLCSSCLQCVSQGSVFLLQIKTTQCSPDRLQKGGRTSTETIKFLNPLDPGRQHSIAATRITFTCLSHSKKTRLEALIHTKGS